MACFGPNGRVDVDILVGGGGGGGEECWRTGTGEAEPLAILTAAGRLVAFDLA